jgi:hypothetical protein
MLDVQGFLALSGSPPCTVVGVTSEEMIVTAGCRARRGAPCAVTGHPVRVSRARAGRRRQRSGPLGHRARGRRTPFEYFPARGASSLRSIDGAMAVRAVEALAGAGPGLLRRCFTGCIRSPEDRRYALPGGHLRAPRAVRCLGAADRRRPVTPGRARTLRAMRSGGLQSGV